MLKRGTAEGFIFLYIYHALVLHIDVEGNELWRSSYAGCDDLAPFTHRGHWRLWARLKDTVQICDGMDTAQVLHLQGPPPTSVAATDRHIFTLNAKEQKLRRFTLV